MASEVKKASGILLIFCFEQQLSSQRAFFISGAARETARASQLAFSATSKKQRSCLRCLDGALDAGGVAAALEPLRKAAFIFDTA